MEFWCEVVSRDIINIGKYINYGVNVRTGDSVTWGVDRFVDDRVIRVLDG